MLTKVKRRTRRNNQIGFIESMENCNSTVGKSYGKFEDQFIEKNQITRGVQTRSVDPIIARGEKFDKLRDKSLNKKLSNRNFGPFEMKELDEEKHANIQLTPTNNKNSNLTIY